MTRIDFYVLPEGSRSDSALLACRLAEKAYSRGHRIFIHTASREQAETLDRLLWTFRQDSFLPHAISGTELAAVSPIQIGHGVEPAGDCDVLLNLDEAVPEFFSRFHRVAEPVGNDEPARQRARDHYRYYKERGYPLETHRLKR